MQLPALVNAPEHGHHALHFREQIFNGFDLLLHGLGLPFHGLGLVFQTLNDMSKLLLDAGRVAPAICPSHHQPPLAATISHAPPIPAPCRPIYLVNS